MMNPGSKKRSVHIQTTLFGLFFYLLMIACSQPVELEGYWQDTVSHRGDTISIGFQFEKDSINYQTVFVVPEYGWNINLGPASFKGDSVSIGRYKIVYNDESKSLVGTLPSALVPKFPIGFALKKSPLPVLKLNQYEESTREPDFIINVGEEIWAGLSHDASQLYVSTLDGNYHALDPQKQNILWTYATDGALRGKSLVSNGTSYLYSDMGTLYKISNEGKSIWAFDFEVDSTDRNAQTYDYYSAIPLLIENTIYYGNGSGDFAAINDSDGSLLWHYAVEGAIRTTPVILNNQVYFGSFDGKLYSLDTNNGSLKWNYDTGHPVTSGPTIVNNHIIVGSRSYELMALNALDGSGPVWNYYFWFSWIESTPVLYDGVIYVGSSDAQKVFAFNPEDGTKNWEFDTGGSPWASPLATEKYVFTGTVGTENYFTKHYAYLICLDRSSGEEVWRFSLEPVENGYYGFTGSPVFLNGVVWVAATNGNIYGFNVDRS